MSNVPQPVEGSIAYTSNGVPSGITPGFYLDEDIALMVNSQRIVIVAPTYDQAKLIAANLPRTKMGWLAYKVDSEVLSTAKKDYVAWLELASESVIAGELSNESPESQGGIKQSSLATS